MDPVTLFEMMDARERRAALQSRLIQQYNNTVISFTLNIPGPVKVLPGIPKAFDYGCQKIETMLEKHHIAAKDIIKTRTKTGYEAFYSVSAAPETIKAFTVLIEDDGDIGRLFDIDIIKTDGTKVSREDLGLPSRLCLLCSRPAHECSRSRAHTVEELTSQIRILLTSLPLSPVLSFISQTAYTALMEEVGTTPKPGLVDRHDNGAHKDMCYDTFAASTKAIVPYLAEMAELGLQWTGSPEDLFGAVRPIGIQAETAMFKATSGVNTHKGLIFSLGIIMSAAAWYYNNSHTFHAEEILKLCGQMTRLPLEKDFQKIDLTAPKTHGEKLFALYGCKGIRGEAQSGFSSVRNISLPVLKQAEKSGNNTNNAFIQTLLTLMAHVDDTNVLIRTDHLSLLYVKEQAARILSLGGAETEAGLDAVRALNEDFIARNISPGGCADLLAVTIFLWRLEQYKEEEHEAK